MTESEHVRLARATIEAYVKGDPLPSDADAPENMRTQEAGAFVSLKKHGVLRGCIGTIRSTCANLAQEIIRNAVQSATCDPRFPPVTPQEVSELTISVDVLHPPEPIPGIESLDPSQYGVIVSCDARQGLLLPNLEGVETVQDQVSIACRKAGILEGEPVTLKRFKVDRFT